MKVDFVGPRFFSKQDERIFDDWLASIPSVRHVQGVGNRLVITLTRRVPKRDLAALDTIFRRYRLNRRVLSKLPGAQERWFADPAGHWEEIVRKSRRTLRRAKRMPLPPEGGNYKIRRS